MEGDGCKFWKFCISIYISSRPFFHNPATNSEWVQEGNQKKQPNNKRIKPALWYVVKNPLLILASLYILYCTGTCLRMLLGWMLCVTLDHLPFFVVVVLWVVVERTTTSVLIYVRYKLRDDGGWGPSVFVVIENVGVQNVNSLHYHFFFNLQLLRF